MNLEQRIQALDDRDAVRILTSFAQHQSDYHDQGMTPDWSQALVNETGVSSIGPISEGLLARAALLVLADDPQHCEVLEALVSSPAPSKTRISCSVVYGPEDPLFDRLFIPSPSMGEGEGGGER
jgi:hypothetical protein